MGNVLVNRDQQLAQIEERWLSGMVDVEAVAIHVLVYRRDEAGTTQMGASAHVHKVGGGHIMVWSGPPKLDDITWSTSAEAAVSLALDILEARQDLNV